MAALHLTRHIDSETLHLPELLPFVGKDVDIIVMENPEQRLKRTRLKAAAKKRKKPIGNPVQFIEKWRGLFDDELVAVLENVRRSGGGKGRRVEL